VGALTATGYLAYRYNTSSRSADHSKTERVEIQKSMTELVLDETDDWDDQTVICIVDSAYRGLFEQETDYTVAVYVLDQEAFAAGQAADNTYTIDTLWGYSKSGPKKDPYGSLIKVATAEVQKNEKTGEILSITIAPLQ
jgi:predicted RNA-binding protein